ncbi:MAG: TIGR02281 family clan AA aspartic protease [Alphaproteobacteria bacterium]|nr:MAG: TIGR02281 family clan AA aspartic protease [Alphaproteobacteria bacterium]
MAGLDGDSLAELLWLGLLLVALIGWYVSGRARPRLGVVLQHALVWVFLFAGVVALYGLRDRLDRTLFPARPVADAAGRIVLLRAQDGHFYARAEVNGTPVRFLVDTGASDILLSREDARRVGIDPDALAYYGTARTANGIVRMARVRLETLRLGPIESRDVPAWVGAGEMSGSLLGMSYLAHFARITIDGDRMTLEPRRP